jgi:hypothetical protein
LSLQNSGHGVTRLSSLYFPGRFVYKLRIYLPIFLIWSQLPETWRDGFYVAVNYSSDNYTMNIPGTAQILIGEKTLKPAGVLVWKE